MRAEKIISEETLQRLWSEIALLRREIEQAERGQVASEVRLMPSIAAAQECLKPRVDRHR